MRHARKDYQRIQDPKGLIPKEEPVFLLRAQDKLFIPMLQMYRTLGAAIGMDPKMLQHIKAHEELAKLWPTTKVSDM